MEQVTEHRAQARHTLSPGFANKGGRLVVIDLPVPEEPPLPAAALIVEPLRDEAEQDIVVIDEPLFELVPTVRQIVNGKAWDGRALALMGQISFLFFPLNAHDRDVTAAQLQDHGYRE